MPWDTIEFWHWLALGALLMIAEVFAPGVVFLWLGIAAGVTGLIVLAAPDLHWGIQLILFGGLSLASVFAGRSIVKRRAAPTDHPDLNRRGRQYVGQTFTLDEPTRNGRGRLRVGDTVWAIALPAGVDDLDAGARVTVAAVEGTTLRIDPARASEQAI